MNGAVDPTVAKKVKPLVIFDICFSTRKAVLQWLNYRQQDQLLWQ